MFKPAHIVQAVLLLTLTGCAAAPPAGRLQVRDLPLVEPGPDVPGQRLNRLVTAPSQTTQAKNGAIVSPDGIIPETSVNTAPAALRPHQLDNRPASKPILDNIAVPNNSSHDLPLPDADQFAQAVATRYQIPINHVRKLLDNASYNSQVVRLMTPPKTRIRKSWSTYHQRFVDPVRIKAGLQFWREHREQLDTVAAHYGVPASIIVAIIGVETIYGRYMGDFRVLDALATLAFHYPDPARTDRIQLFRKQLADLIVLDYHQVLDASAATGSYAGAIGLPQFMPGSILRYAVDGDEDGKIKLTTSAKDAIASVANFLREHGWITDLPVFAPIQLPAGASTLVQGGLKPTLNWSELQRQGATERPANGSDYWKNTLLGVIDLIDEPRGTAEYRTGTPNFFAIVEYNRSYFYAASVADLARTLAARMDEH